MSTRSRNPLRDNAVHVVKVMCKTCIFRPGNLMSLDDGRVEQMVRDAKRHESCIICHWTLDGDRAICRGFFDRHKTAPLQIAERLQFIRFVEVR